MKFDSKKRVALFGTSADPPTIGHEKIIEELSKNYSLIIIYASDNPKKNHRENIFFRSLLLKTLITDLNRSNIIFDQNISSPWAIESVQKCKEIYSLTRIDFVIGSDLISDIFNWKNCDKLLQQVKLNIIKRDGYPINTNSLGILKANKVDYEISSLNIPNISSSMVRLNKKYSDLPKSLVDIVKNNNLYLSN